MQLAVMKARKMEEGYHMLTIMTGPAGSRKSDLLLNQILENAGNGMTGQLLLTPAQCSHETERRLAAAGGPSICRSAEVLSFSRLATRVFSAEGGLCRQTLDGGGRVLAMARALELVHSRLKVYNKVSSRPAFYTDLIATIDELKSYAVTSEQLHRTATEVGGSLAAKLEELALILESYDAVCAQGKADPRDTLTLLADRLLAGTWAGGRAIFVDGFSRFTMQELHVLEALLQSCREMVITLTCDGLQGTMPIYDSVRETAGALQRLAARTGHEVRLIELPRAEQAKPAFAYLNENLFASGLVPCPVPTPELTLLQAESQREECQIAVRRILDLVQSGARYADIAVAVTDQKHYAPVLEGLCAQYNIPIYMSGMQSIQHKPVITCLLSALAAATGGMEASDVVAYLKTGLSPAEPDVCDLLENYALVWNLRGTDWADNFEPHSVYYGKKIDESPEALARLNAGREAAVVPLVNLQTALRDAADAGEMIYAVYHFIEEIGLPARIEKLARELYAQGRGQEAAECVQLYRIIISALEQFYSVLGQTLLQPAAFCRLLELQLSQCSVSTIPVTIDAVQCGTVMYLRNRAPKHLLVLGACDGLFPARPASSGVLSAADRQTLMSYDLTLAPDPEMQLQEDMADILGLLSSPTESLQISCQAGAAPASLYSRLCGLFPGSVIHAEGWELALYRKDTAAALLAENGQATGLEFLPALCASLPEVPDLADGLRQKAALQPGTLSRKMITGLWGSPVRLSASKLESFADCPHKYFLHYGLQLQEYKRAGLNALDFGNFVHTLLELIVQDVLKVKGQDGFHTITEEELRSITDTHIVQQTAEQLNAAEMQEPHIQYLHSRNMDEVRRIVDTLARELKLSEFVPEEFELQFGQNKKEAPYRITAGDIAGEITGKVDRVDAFREGEKHYFRVIDYKTGNTSFDYAGVYQGRGLQMLIYMFALERNTTADDPRLPAGVLYMPAKSAIQKADTDLSEAEAAKLYQKEWKRSGLILEDPAVLNAMEKRDKERNPVFMPYTVNKSGVCGGDLMTQAQLQLLRKHVEQKLQEILGDMAAGLVSPAPYSEAPCRKCDYAAICHPDKSCIRYTASVGKKAFWEKLEERYG